VATGIGKGDRVGLVAPNGIDWAVVALGIMRIGATLVPLSTLLRPPELLAQLRAASVTDLVTVREFRGRAYVDELEAAVPGIGQLGRGRSRLAAVPSLRHLWPADDIPVASAAA